jgi:hypothetical protein
VTAFTSGAASTLAAAGAGAAAAAAGAGAGAAAAGAAASDALAAGIKAGRVNMAKIANKNAPPIILIFRFSKIYSCL